MKDVTRAAPDEAGPSEPIPRGEDSSTAAPKFVGDAMAALLRSADVKVQRGDETRVLSRPREALAALERRQPGSVDDPAQLPRTHSSGPPRPRVDLALWIVLALGLFAIAGWMLAVSI